MTDALMVRSSQSTVVPVTAEDIMARCIEFVRQNEGELAELHRREERTYQVQLQRACAEEVWGLTWSAKAFSTKRRILEAIVPNSPAGRWNASHPSGRRLEVGDELLAVNGKSSWEEMTHLRHLLSATLSFMSSSTAIDKQSSTPELTPPLESLGDYTLSCGENWHGHSGGEWLYNTNEKAYFHMPTGKLYMANQSDPSSFTCVITKALGPTSEDAQPRRQSTAVDAVRMRGLMKWFNARRGFGCLTPLVTASGVQVEDVFLHHSDVLQEVSSTGETLPVPMLAGAPVTYVFGKKDDGKLTAHEVALELDLAALCVATAATGKAAKATETAKIEVKATDGRPLGACFTGFTAEGRSVGGAEYVALRLAKDLEACLTGREAGGEKGAKAALAAAARQTQQGFLEYAHRLSKNSASLWLSADVTACTALVYGPDSDGHAKLIVTLVGSGGALVLNRKGGVTAGFGSASTRDGDGQEEDDDDAQAPSKKRRLKAEDVLKAADSSLRGPEFTFQIFAPRAGPVKGFGAHAWQKHGGSAAGLQVDIQLCSLSWEEDAVVVLGSDCLWRSIPDVLQMAHICLSSFQSHEPVSDPASRLLHAAKASKHWREDCAAVVLRLPWCIGIEAPDYAERRPGSALDCKGAAPGDDDDMFASPC